MSSFSQQKVYFGNFLQNKKESMHSTSLFHCKIRRKWIGSLCRIQMMHVCVYCTKVVSG